MFFRWERESPDAVFLRQPIDGQWRTMTYREAGQEVRRMAAVLGGLALPAESRIAILSKNCNYWILADLAIMMSGHVSVPLYPNLTARSVRQILEHSEAKVCFVGKLDQFEQMRPGIPEGVYGITFPIYAQSGYDRWDDLCARVEPMSGEPRRALDELMTIIYTSGTTGEPKGVMHRFQNFAFAATHALRLFDDLGRGSRFFSYLPLCHIAERVVVEVACLYCGGAVSFAESLDLFAKNLQDTQPHVFLGVPRIWTKFQMAILEKLPPARLRLLLKIPFLSSYLKNKIKRGLGLAEARYALSGAAPIAASLLEWYAALGINIQEGYAMTENCAYSHFTLRGQLRFGSVGRALPHNEVRIGEGNEIQVKSPCILNGYYKNPELTAEALTSDGFLRTGDTGHIDDEGFLHITGRVKELFKTGKGKYVAPSPIEMRLLDNTAIEQVCVTGPGLPQPIGLVVLSQAAREQDREELAAALLDTMVATNQELDQHERLKTVVVVGEEWTVENSLLTPTLKIKRNEVDARYGQHYERWYAVTESLVWWE
jgi:long-subunit acyl-CoA synthetase (AMP-forming)